jgi:hypothetical protein
MFRSPQAFAADYRIPVYLESKQMSWRPDTQNAARTATPERSPSSLVVMQENL